MYLVATRRRDKKRGVGKIDRTTAAKSFAREEIDAKWRPCREKPQRDKECKEERADLCGSLRKKPDTYFTEKLDLIMDNKGFDVPTTTEARKYLAKLKVRGQIRTASEGLDDGMTKPSNRKHRKNLGGKVHLVAGISGGRVVLWEYFEGRWNGKKAAEMYKGPIRKILKAKRGDKPSYLICEDNDPTGYKSSAGMKAKKECKIKTIKWPRYSPDLMPLDFSLWENVSDHLAGANV